jgi:N-acetylmuramoyl-L-alanine amidase
VFKKFGVVLDRVSSSQATQGAKVKKTELQPGDLVFFDTNGGHNRINHVGMYIGSGNFIQASSDYSEVVISSLEDGFYANTYMTARRVLK